MKPFKMLFIIFTLLILSAFAGRTVQALEVGSDAELLDALKNENVDTVTINYSNANLSEFVTIGRSLTIDGNGCTLTAKNGIYLTVKHGASLVLRDIVLTGENDFAIKSNGNIRLEGTIEFAGGYGLLLNSNAFLDSAAVLVSRSQNKIALAANTNGGEITIFNASISDTTTCGVLLYIYRGGGCLTLSGVNSFKSSYGSAIASGKSSNAQQKIVIAAHSSVTVDALNAGSETSYAAAFNIGECSLEMKKGSAVSAKGGICCDSFKTEEGCTVNAEIAAPVSNGGAISVLGKISASPSATIGSKNTVNLNGFGGLFAANCDIETGNETSIASSLSDGITLHAAGGSVVLGDGVIINSFSDGGGISAKGSFVCGSKCDITLASKSSEANFGISAGSKISLGEYSVIKCKSSKTALRSESAVYLGEYACINCEMAETGISVSDGIQTGKGCTVYIKDTQKFGIHSSGTLLADTVSFGEENDIRISSDSAAIYSGEAVIFNKGCSAVIAGGSSAPAIWVDTALNAQGYLRITGSSVAVTSELTEKSGIAAVSVIGSVIAENSSKLEIDSNGSFGLFCTAGDLLASTDSTVSVEGGCGIFVENGNIRVSNGGALYAKGTLDSGIRVSNGMLRVGENSTIITEGERFGAEMLASGDIWLDSPKLFDFRSKNSSAVFIQNGVFSAANVETLSAWYGIQNKANAETWWNVDVSTMKPWEINFRLSENELGYADYTQHSVNGTVHFENGASISSEGFEANIETFRIGDATRLSAFKTRPVSPSNYLFIPAGRAFSWQLEASSVEGTGEKFELLQMPNSGKLTLSESGLLSYSAMESTRGEQHFSYVVTALDGAQSLPVEVTVNVTRSKPPAAYNHTFDVAANGTLVTAVSATDFDGAISSLSVTHEPEHGRVSLSSDGTILYTPDSTYVGLDSFTYMALDNDSDASNEAIVTLLVGMSGETTARNATYIAAKNEETDGTLNASMSKGEVFSHIEVTTFPKYGTLEIDNLDFTYIPPENFAGTETFGYIVVGENGEKSNEGFISIITVPSEKPIANALKIDCAAGKAYSGKLSAQDLDGKITTFMVDTYPVHGVLDIDASNGKFTYTADNSYTGEDSFTFYVYDDEGLKSEAVMVSISIDTYLNMLKSSGKLTEMIVIGAIAFFSVAVITTITVTGVVRKRRKMDREYETQYENYYSDYPHDDEW